MNVIFLFILFDECWTLNLWARRGTLSVPVEFFIFNHISWYYLVGTQSLGSASIHTSNDGDDNDDDDNGYDGDDETLR